MTESHLVLSETPAIGVRRIALNRPDKRNALDMATRLQLIAAFGQAQEDETVRAILLTGQGGSFCAGGDLQSMPGLTLASARARLKHGHAFVSSLAEGEKPLVAAVEGPAIGVGASLVLFCDIVVAGRGARIGFPFVRLGVVPDWGLLYTLPQRIGMGPARRLLMTGATIGAEEAYDLGIVDLLVEDGEVQASAVKAAADLAAGARGALAMTRRGLLAASTSLEAALEYESVAQSACLTGEEFKEGLAAFKEKRKPAFP